MAACPLGLLPLQSCKTESMAALKEGPAAMTRHARSGSREEGGTHRDTKGAARKTHVPSAAPPEEGGAAAGATKKDSVASSLLPAKGAVKDLCSLPQCWPRQDQTGQLLLLLLLKCHGSYTQDKLSSIHTCRQATHAHFSQAWQPFPLNCPPSGYQCSCCCASCCCCCCCCTWLSDAGGGGCPSSSFLYAPMT